MNSLDRSWEVAGPRQFAAQVYPRDAPGVRSFRLRKWVVDQGSPVPIEMVPYMRACVEEADRISNAMAERNQRGRDLERTGHLEEAIELYERNVSDLFDGEFPYDRLRVIYRRQNRYEDALSVCRAFVSMADRLRELGSPRRDLARKRQRFSERASRLNDLINQINSFSSGCLLQGEGRGATGPHGRARPRLPG
jgi:tetratricopeptide (TPR) repeat protein